ncbi:MAG TPA: radical SAM family heme chaperone HemW [Acidisarcina sp.]|nr:radical SAM family heme chaperone HemW [Acidisarcina sp.]
MADSPHSAEMLAGRGKRGKIKDDTPTAMDSLGLYISIPFCRSKCSYCNFASGVYPSSAFPGYVDRLCGDLERMRAWAEEQKAPLPRRVDSIYLGGGTPSILPPDLLQRLFAEIHRQFRVAPSAEITIECAPGQIDDAFLEGMQHCGVNRVSFGVQSFVDREAAVTGRLHNCEVALRDVKRVQSAGIASVNVDLIAGLPYQTMESWHESLKTLAATGADHASIYMLEVDDGSRLGRELLADGGRYHAAAVPDDDAMAEMYLEAIGFLREQGIEQYEISNFARVGAESRHNLRYWQRQPYLGLGVDAHSMLIAEDGHTLRLATTDDLGEYLAGPRDPSILHLSEVEQMEEEWFLGLRLARGVSLGTLTRQYGRAKVDAFRPVLSELLEEKLLEKYAGRLRLTSRGRLISNDVFARFIAVTSEESSRPELISVV